MSIFFKSFMSLGRYDCSLQFMEYLSSHFTDENKGQRDKVMSSEVIEPLSDGLEFELLIGRANFYSKSCTRFPESKGSFSAGWTKKS